MKLGSRLLLDAGQIIFIDVARMQLVGVNCPPPVVAWHLPRNVTVPTFLLKLADINLSYAVVVTF